ncbi:MAG: preprotein translocase subunit YajC [Betaproteobacteria bacterium]|nr:preprotein translocase subunit YajC [Betaproteobacteria bacterium]
MAKIILLVLGLLLAYWILKTFRKRVDKPDRPPQTGAGEDMVRCEHCGIHLPRSESLTTRGHFYCSPEHQRQHVRSD